MCAKVRGCINGLSSLGLQRRLLEVAVVVGADEDTGLLQRKIEQDLLVGEDNVLFQIHFQAHLLDILSGKQDNKSEESSLKDAAKTWRKPAWKSEKSTKPSNPKHQTVNKLIQRNRSVRLLRKRANKDESVSVSTEFLSNLPYICLPDDSKVYKEDQKPQIHFAVLTDVNGTRHYAAILKLYHSMYASTESRNGTLSWRLSKGYPFNQPCQDGCEVSPCYVPLCICFVIGAPYLNVMKSALSCLCKEWKDAISYQLFRKNLQKYVTNLSVIVCPPLNLRVHFSLSDLPLTMQASSEINLPHLVNDIDLSVPLFVFLQNKDTLLQVLACILLEQRIVFLSQSYSLITLVVEALLTFINPFIWPHQYVPILFSEIIDFVACPGIFLMGCHTMHMAQIKQVENDQILVDLDTGQAFVCPSYDDDSAVGRSTLKPLRSKTDCHFPPSLVERTLKRLSTLRLFDASKLSDPCAVSADDLREQLADGKEKMNRNIKAIFMEMMVDLFSSTIHFLDHEVNQFRSSEFLTTLEEPDLLFYAKVVQTYMFKKFVQDRLKRTSDTFSELVQERHRASGDVGRRTLGKLRSVSDVIYPIPGNTSHRRYGSDTSPNPTRKNTWLSAANSESDCSLDGYVETDLMAVKDLVVNSGKCLSVFLPSFPAQEANLDIAHFYQRCADVITDVMGKIPWRDDDSTKQLNRTTRASCLLMRGVYLIASGNLVQGLSDLHETAKQDFKIFPLSIIQTIMSSLSVTEMQLVRNQSFYKGDAFYSAFEGTKSTESCYYSDEDLPCIPVDRAAFLKLLEKSDVTNADDVINWLFDALSNQSQSVTSQEQWVVDPEAFAAFYHTWKQGRHDCETALRSILSVGNVNIGLLVDSERILKVSGVVSSNRGSGRLILTTEKILFMTELYEECKLVARLARLAEVKLTRVKTLFRSNTALVLKEDGDVMFRVLLKYESELWKFLIDEMKTGRMLSHDWKDPHVTLDVAAQNVAVADALYRAAKDEGLVLMDKIMIWIKKLCHFTELHRAGRLPILPQETNEMLVLRIDVAPKEAKKSDVNAILYSTADGQTPKVWVALSSSKIRFIDVTKWTLDPRPIADCPSNLTCLCSFEKELWVGSSDDLIYVIDCDSLKKTQVIHDPSSPVLSLFCCGDRMVGVTSSGEVISWDKETKRKTFSFNIPQPHNELVSATAVCRDNIICCCSKLSLSLYTLDGVRNQLLTLSEFFSTRMVESEITCCLCAGSEIWVGDSHGSLYQWLGKREDSNEIAGDGKMRFVPKWTGVLYDVGRQVAVTSIMLNQQRKIWIGNSAGDITILNSDTFCQERTLKAHDDSVTSLCLVENRYVISGSRSIDGKLAAWRSEQL